LFSHLGAGVGRTRRIASLGEYRPSIRLIVSPWVARRSRRRWCTATTCDTLDHDVGCQAAQGESMKRPWTNSMRGSVVGPVVQAGAVHGDVYFNTQDAAHEADPVLIVTTTTFPVFHSETRLDHAYSSRAVEIRILVETRSKQAVVLHDLRPTFIRRLPPEHWLVQYAVQTSAMKVRGMHIDLDSDTPQPRILDGPGFPFKVVAADPEMFRVILVSDTADAVTLELAWTCAGRNGITTIDQDGSPFSVDSVYGITDKLTFSEAVRWYQEQGHHEHADRLQRQLAELKARDHDDQPPQNTETAN
jgi:hypothetical protein